MPEADDWLTGLYAPLHTLLDTAQLTDMPARWHAVYDLEQEMKKWSNDLGILEYRSHNGTLFKVQQVATICR
jgi:hypothetical protein